MENMVERLCKGDEDAFKSFFHRHKDAVYKYALLHLKDASIAEDIVQEVFFKFWKKTDQLDPQQNIRAYLYTVARHAVFEELRKRIQFQTFTDYAIRSVQYHHNAVEENIYLSELEGIYKKAIKLLPAQRQKIFRLSKLEHMSHDEIAALLNISKNTVRDQLVKGNKFVKAYILKNSSIAILTALFIDIL